MIITIVRNREKLSQFIELLEKSYQYNIYFYDYIQGLIEMKIEMNTNLMSMTL